MFSLELNLKAVSSIIIAMVEKFTLRAFTCVYIAFIFLPTSNNHLCNPRFLYFLAPAYRKPSMSRPCCRSGFKHLFD